MTSVDQIDVLHLIGSLSPGGAERNLYYLARSMAASKFRYGIACLMRRGELASEIEALGIPIFELGYRQRKILLTVIKLAGLLRHYRVRVLHTHLFESGLVGRLAGWFAGTPVIITHEHGKTLWKRWYHRLFERLAIYGTDLRIVVSKDIMDLRMRLEATPPQKLRLVYNAVDPEPFIEAESQRPRKRSELGFNDEFVVGTTGRLVHAKAFDVMLEVAREVAHCNSKVRFVIIGEGPLRDDLERLKFSLGLEGIVTFLGKRSDVPELLAALDLYLMTSRREGLPLSLIEAMLAARPIVATAVGGIPDTLTDRVDGILVPSDDVEAIARAVVDLAADADLRRALGSAARKKAIERYSPGNILSQLEAIYTDFLSKK